MATQEQKVEFEFQEVEVSDVSEEIPETPKESDITEVEEETQLEDYEKALSKSVTKAQIAKGTFFPVAKLLSFSAEARR